MRPYQKSFYAKKVWNKLSLFNKIVYYMKPFLYHLGEVWMQPLPLPTLIKIIYSVFLFTIILVPLLYPALIGLLTYSTCQFFMERHTEVKFPRFLNLVGYVAEVVSTKPDGIYAKGIKIHFDRFFVLSSSLISIIDYIRIVFTALHDD